MIPQLTYHAAVWRRHPFRPYARMSLVGLVLALGLAVASLRPGLGSKTAFVLLMVLVKLAADAATHLWERRLFRSHATARPLKGGT